MSGLKTYRELSKSGIVTLVLISVLGGYLCGQPFEHPFDPQRLLLTLFGVLFLASGSSALNQVQDREMDAKMPRTAKRPIPSGRISTGHALAFSLVSIAVGIALLSRISLQVLVLGLVAILLYNGLYTLWWKKHWAYAAIPGAIPGAIPILMGYSSASGRTFAPGGLYLFLVLFYWQMPHFWVLALRFRKDYQSGGVPTLPVSRGAGITVKQIILWCLAYVGLAFVAPLFLKVRSLYLSITIIVSAIVLWELRGFVREPESKSWLRFFLWVNFSLIFYLAAAVADLWSLLLIPYLTR